MTFLTIFGVTFLLTATIFFLTEHMHFRQILSVIKTVADLFITIFVLTVGIIIIRVIAVDLETKNVRFSFYINDLFESTINYIPAELVTIGNVANIGLIFGILGLSLTFTSGYFEFRIGQGLSTQTKSSTTFAVLLLIFGSLLSMATLLDIPKN